MGKLQLLVALGVLACASASITSMSGAAGSAMRLNGGMESCRAVRLGYPVNSDDDPNEPFMHIDPNSPTGPALESSDELGERFDVDWATARRKLGEIIKKREAAAEASVAALHLRALRALAAPLTARVMRQALRLRGGATRAQEATKAASSASTVPVTLEVSVLHIKPINSPKVKVVVCGDGPELGEWDIKKGITMELKESTANTKDRSKQDTFPVHTATLNLPAGKDVEYKYAVVRAEPGDGVQQQWEAQNRKLSVPASGSIHFKNEFVENRDSDPRITDEPFQKLTDIGYQREA